MEIDPVPTTKKGYFFYLRARAPGSFRLINSQNGAPPARPSQIIAASQVLRRFTFVTQSRQSARLFLQVSELGPPHPYPQASVFSPWFGGGGAHSLVGEGPIQMRGQTLWYSRYTVYVLCAL